MKDSVKLCKYCGLTYHQHKKAYKNKAICPSGNSFYKARDDKRVQTTLRLLNADSKAMREAARQANQSQNEFCLRAIRELIDRK